MLLTFLRWESQGEMHYLNVLTGIKAGFWSAVLGDIKLLWEVSFQPLIHLPTENASLNKAVLLGYQIVVGLGILCALFWCIIKRNRYIITLLCFFLPYFIVHILHAFNYHKFYAVVHWIVLLLCAYGWYHNWEMLKQKASLPKVCIWAFQGLILITTIIFFVQLVGMLPEITPISVNSKSLPYICLVLLGIIFLVRLMQTKSRFALRDLTATFLVAVMIVSNQFTLVRIVGNGQRDSEFKLLADWFLEHAQPTEKIVTSAAKTASIFVPRELRKQFIYTSNIKADDPAEFVRQCRKRNITYVSWNSRLGFAPQDRYYKIFKMHNIAVLGKPRDIGPYQYLATVGRYPRYVNIFRIKEIQRSGY